jgi:hypothetical protein
MIILFSFEGDVNTNYVIDWFTYYNCQFKRVDLNKEDFRNIKVFISDNLTTIQLKLFSGEIIDFSECDYFYVRGAGFNQPATKNTTDLPDEVFNQYMVNEFHSLTKFFYSEVNKKSVGCFYNDSHLKLLQLNHARQVGLSICNTLITNNKHNIQNYFNESRIITKAIEDNIGIEHNDRLIVQRVQRVNYKNIEESFFPSLFQNEIDKEYELRIFYLDGKCYTICFKSASDDIDMRDNYSISEYEPYKLPNAIEEKIIKFMDKMKLVSGSLDFIKSKDGNYYFLEVNPNGQYDWVSQYGGYNLHQKVAYFLSSKNRKI